MTERLFVYGTLRYKKIQLRVMGKFVHGKAALLRDYERFKTTIGGGVYFTIRRKSGAQVRGKVLILAPEDFTPLDIYEKGYKRKKVRLDGGEEAWSYVFRK